MSIPGDFLKQGWGVVRLAPWHLAGVFTSSAETENLARTRGRDYTVKNGDRAAGSPEFSFVQGPDGPSL